MVSISSRTAYVLLSAMEEDLRALIEAHATEDAELDDFLGPQLVVRASERRQRDGHKSAATGVAQLVPYLDFQDSVDVLMRHRSLLPDRVGDGLQDLTPEVHGLTEVRNRVAHNRPLEVDDLARVVDCSANLERVSGADWHATRQARAELNADPSYVFRAEADLIVDPVRAIANNLPSPDFDETSLLGRRDERRSLTRALLGAWPVVSILGDGGIGKTALALQVCYDMVQLEGCPFDAIVWVTAKNATLTSSEIVRIEGAVEDSLGLFASATAALGEPGNPENAIEELLEVLGAFPTLLVLDNVETVLDDRFPDLLREIPKDSKVLITSRIGVKTENPYHLTGLSVDDSKKLMRILARVRGFDLAAVATDDDLANWSQRMNCHPAYIKWFMSGLQSGQQPERLLADNGLVLDFCMDNVFRYLGPDARYALKAMVVVPGSHTLAELAYLTDFDATRIQQVVHELTTTNFVAQVRGGSAGTALELSDFARQFLLRTLDVQGEERIHFADKQRDLYAVGGGIQLEHQRDPYAPETIDVRSVGDYSAARELREALEAAADGRYEDALARCSEAANLAPGYHEPHRVEAYVHELAMNYGEAQEAYTRARDLAPQNSYVAYSFGGFMLRSGYDPAGGLRELQRAAQLDPTSSMVQLAISNAHIDTADYGSAADAARYALQQTDDFDPARSDCVFAIARATALLVRELIGRSDWAAAAEAIETLTDAIDGVANSDILVATLDFILWVEVLAESGNSVGVDAYIRGRIGELVAKCRERRLEVDRDHHSRKIGLIRNVTDRGFGFLQSEGTTYFVHARSMWSRADFDGLSPGSILAFVPGPGTGQNPSAEGVYWMA